MARVWSDLLNSINELTETYSLVLEERCGEGGEGESLEILIKAQPMDALCPSILITFDNEEQVSLSLDNGMHWDIQVPTRFELSASVLDEVSALLEGGCVEEAWAMPGEAPYRIRLTCPDSGVTEWSKGFPRARRGAETRTRVLHSYPRRLDA